MEDKEIFEREQASLSEGGGVCEANDGGSSFTQTTANETPSVCPADSQLPQGGSLDSIQPEVEPVGTGIARPRTTDGRPYNVDPTDCEPVEGDAPDAPQESPRHGSAVPPPFRQGGQETPTPTEERAPWYIDLNREEFVAFRMLMARLMGPLRQRIPTLIVSLFCFVMLGGYAVYEWLMGWVSTPDPVLLAGAVLVLIPLVLVCVYMPIRIRRMAEKQYDRSVESGMDFFGELVVYPDCIEKAGQVVTTSIRIDERMLFVETPDVMLIFSPQSPTAIVIPARCATEEMARAVREAADRLPPRNRRFVARLQCRGEAVTPPPPKAKPEELWVNTFTYTAEEYTVVLRGIIQQHFWRMAPLLAAVSMMGALAFGYDGQSVLPCIGYFVAFIALLILFNLVLPLQRVKGQCESLTAHDTTVQVRMDTMALRLKLPKGAENWVLWCDVDHVYEREDFVEIVHNKHSSLYIPKRCIEDLDAFDAVIQRCREKQ